MPPREVIWIVKVLYYYYYKKLSVRNMMVKDSSAAAGKFKLLLFIFIEVVEMGQSTSLCTNI